MLTLNETNDLTRYVGYDTPKEAVQIVCNWLVMRGNTDTRFNIKGQAFDLRKVVKGYQLSKLVDGKLVPMVITSTKQAMTTVLREGTEKGYY